ncbi:MAG: transcription elongation factor GreA [Neisseriaceae bacterium]|jgi:transcription elongation factor GreA|nr:MAG: transcription elongation factor GreA [Neisseriaceae bacterium]
MQKFPMTVNGAKLLNEELARLKGAERSQIIQAIAEARAHGDISENAEYDAAKEKQAFNEGRIAEIESKLSQAQIIDVTNMINDGRVIFGATVNLLDLESDEEITYQIVGDDEADVKIRKISVNTPVARSLIGKQSGDVVEVKVPNGTKEYEILDVKLV